MASNKAVVKNSKVVNEIKKDMTKGGVDKKTIERLSKELEKMKVIPKEQFSFEVNKLQVLLVNKLGLRCIQSDRKDFCFSVPLGFERQIIPKKEELWAETLIAIMMYFMVYVKVEGDFIFHYLTSKEDQNGGIGPWDIFSKFWEILMKADELDENFIKHLSPGNKDCARCIVEFETKHELLCLKIDEGPIFNKFIEVNLEYMKYILFSSREHYVTKMRPWFSMELHRKVAWYKVNSGMQLNSIKELIEEQNRMETVHSEIYIDRNFAKDLYYVQKNFDFHIEMDFSRNMFELANREIGVPYSESLESVIGRKRKQEDGND